MKRLVVIAAALLTLGGVSVLTATASSASVCEPNGTGCTQAGTYPGPNAVISNDYTGFKVVWTESVVQPYSSGVPLYWTAYMTYTNIDSASLTLVCDLFNWPDASYVSEHMSGGSGDDGTVSAESTSCSQNPGLAVSVAPGGTYTLSATFHNVPWPGSAVAITWGNAGTSPDAYPFASKPPNPGPPSASGKACVFNAPTGGVTITVLGKKIFISGHVGWAYLADPTTGAWEYGANEGATNKLGSRSRTWLAQGKWSDVISVFKNALPGYHPGNYYATYRCTSVAAILPDIALGVAQNQYGEKYEIPNSDCLSQTVDVLATYGASIDDAHYLLNAYYWVPNNFYASGYMSSFGPKQNLQS